MQSSQLHSSNAVSWLCNVPCKISSTSIELITWSCCFASKQVHCSSRLMFNAHHLEIEWCYISAAVPWWSSCLMDPRKLWLFNPVNCGLRPEVMSRSFTQWYEVVMNLKLKLNFICSIYAFVKWVINYSNFVIQKIDFSTDKACRTYYGLGSGGEWIIICLSYSIEKYI